jgi:hypothetical protein
MAFSYAWDGEVPSQMIEIDACHTLVTPYLEAALRQLHYPSAVNQEEIDELRN